MDSNEECLSEKFGSAEIGIAGFQTGISSCCKLGGIWGQNPYLPGQNFPQDIQSCYAFALYL
ncbi:hypothetical protein [Neisseria wadsworthii]|uniref:Uncharacterized protein n=1 Tax=Neisseria wadsworthii 9715 TaxID=1030841 RepID=G4CQL8_9NEIS|nr:hypothetical protein [Neisseria wadsworthii]EGZ46279.1 hypothetical protein HMPREF9370_1378 [Neisseria wadsworthii 9715]QMT35120.1 hypothetical protein H3L96_08630 [Neisseria wadsworthii]